MFVELVELSKCRISHYYPIRIAFNNSKVDQLFSYRNGLCSNWNTATLNTNAYIMTMHNIHITVSFVMYYGVDKLFLIVRQFRINWDQSLSTMFFLLPFLLGDYASLNNLLWGSSVSGVNEWCVKHLEWCTVSIRERPGAAVCWKTQQSDRLYALEIAEQAHMLRIIFWDFEANYMNALQRRDWMRTLSE